MKRLLVLLLSISSALVATVSFAQSDQFAVRSDAEKMVKSAVAEIKKNKAGVLAEINGGAAKWKDRDLYLQAFTLEGVVLAHGTNPNFAGRGMLALKDPTGRPFVAEQVEMGKKQQSFWADYSYTDPVSKKVLPKETYCERVEDFLVCGGIYKR
jgi:cytochrome c